MPNYTSKFNLTKPLPTDLYDVEVQNGNMDKIDEALAGAPNIHHVSANLSTVGWYRVGTINTSNTGAENTSNSVSISQITIGGVFSERNPSPFLLTAYHNYGSYATLYQQPTTANPTQVDSVRLYPIDNNTCGLDVHYMQNNLNRVNVSVMPHLGSFTPGTFEDVSELTGDARAIVELSKDGNICKAVVASSATDLTAGVSELATGKVYVCYE